MRLFLISGGVVTVLLATGILLAWKTVRHWTRPGPTKEALARPAATADLRMQITLEQSTERMGHDRMDFEFREVKVVLSNSKGKAVESPEIRVGLDGIDLPLIVPTGNYYDRYPQYRLRDDAELTLTPDTVRHFTLNRDNGGALLAARIHLPKNLGIEGFHVPETHPADRDLEISWLELGTPAELVIYRTVTFTDEHGNHGFICGSPNSEDVIRKKIGPGFMRSASGKIIVPAAYLVIPGGEKVSTVDLEITASTAGEFTQPFLPGGRVIAFRKLTFHIDIISPEPKVVSATRRRASKT